MFPPLPQAPPPPQVQLGHQGTPPPAQPGTMGYQQGAAGQISQGISQFMQSYFGMKDSLQQHYRSKFMNAISDMSQGLYSPGSADMNKILGWAQKADIPLR